MWHGNRTWHDICHYYLWWTNSGLQTFTHETWVTSHKTVHVTVYTRLLIIFVAKRQKQEWWKSGRWNRSMCGVFNLRAAHHGKPIHRASKRDEEPTKIQNFNKIATITKNVWQHIIQQRYRSSLFWRLVGTRRKLKKQRGWIRPCNSFTRSPIHRCPQI